MNANSSPEFMGKMITGDVESAPILRRSFALAEGHGEPKKARLLVTAFGIVEAYVNGACASADVLTPGWTSYERRLRFAEWDVTSLLRPLTTIVLSVGNGWYLGRLGWLGLAAVYGKRRAAAAEIRIEFEDGFVQRVATEESWEHAASGILFDDLYDGQHIDARELTAASAHNSDDHLFSPVEVLPFDGSMLEPYVAPSIRRQEEFAPSSVTELPDGSLLLDFGQNLVGWLRIRVHGESGTELVVHHAEVLEHGDLALRPLRSAKACDRFTLSGGADEFEPTFTTHGFRYARIENWPEGSDSAQRNVRAVVVGSDLVRTGKFECSNESINRLHQNVVWGMRGNFVGLPTDCPQRDERMGYVGDLAAFAPTATFLYDVNDFLLDWFRDLNVEQAIAQGQVPLTVPNTLKYEPTMYQAPPEGVVIKPAPMAMWQDGAVWIPWAMWEAYGDRRILEQQRESVHSYLTIIENALEDSGVLTAGYQLGDWLDPAAPPEDPRAARADREVLATACMFRTAALAARISDALGDSDEATRRRALAERIRAGFVRTYVELDGRIRSDAPAVYAVALAFGLVSGPDATRAGTRLAELVAEGGYVIATGFIGTPFILHALSSTGHSETAYRMLLQRRCPSWLYQVGLGATTIWERWDSMLPDGSVNPGEMTSFNHYAFGSVGDWLHKIVAGISPLEPGYRRVLFAPTPGGDVTFANAELRTAHGVVKISWRVQQGNLSVRVSVPNGATGIVRFPSGLEYEVDSGTHEFQDAFSVVDQ